MSLHPTPSTAEHVEAVGAVPIGDPRSRRTGSSDARVLEIRLGWRVLARDLKAALLWIGSLVAVVASSLAGGDLEEERKLVTKGLMALLVTWRPGVLRAPLRLALRGEELWYKRWLRAEQCIRFVSWWMRLEVVREGSRYSLSLFRGDDRELVISKLSGEEIEAVLAGLQRCFPLEERLGDGGAVVHAAADYWTARGCAEVSFTRWLLPD